MKGFRPLRVQISGSQFRSAREPRHIQRSCPAEIAVAYQLTPPVFANHLQTCRRKVTKSVAHRNLGTNCSHPHRLEGNLFADLRFAHVRFELEEVDPCRAMSLQTFTPAPVRIATSVLSSREQTSAATQRVPLPEISASEPSALMRRAITLASLSEDSHSTPSAPIPIWRSQQSVSG